MGVIVGAGNTCILPRRFRFKDLFAGKSGCAEENYEVYTFRYDVRNRFLVVEKIKKGRGIV